MISEKSTENNCDTKKNGLLHCMAFFCDLSGSYKRCPEILRSSLYGCLPRENPIQETWQRKRQFIYDSTRWWMDLYSFLPCADITGPSLCFFHITFQYRTAFHTVWLYICFACQNRLSSHNPRETQRKSCPTRLRTWYRYLCAGRLEMQTNKVQWTKKTTVCTLRFRCWGPTHFQISHVFQCPLCTRELHLQHSQPSVAKCKSWVLKFQPVTPHIL